MGLDQYAYIVAHDDKDGEFRTEIAYWRKHNRLQGWMSALAIVRGVVGSAREFNCVDLELEESDLDDLESDVKGETLPKTDGFFFGADSYDSYKMSHLMEEDLSFIKKARDAFSRGYKVVYSSWW